jgi:RND family efflux transporter MFP subunit
LDRFPVIALRSPSTIGALLFAGFMLTACGSSDPRAPAQSPQRADSVLPVETSVVSVRDLSRQITLSAPVEPLRLVELAAQTAGVLTRLLVEEGDRVQKDQVLGEIDVREMQAELARARALLNQQEVNLARMETLRERGFIDAASLTIARTELEVARADVGLWQTRVDFGTLRAPFNGIVTARHVEPGEAVSQYAPLLGLADFDHLVVRFGLSELDVAGMAVGDTVQVSIDALAGAAPLAAVVRRIMPTTESASRLVTVEVELPADAARNVRLGYLARATLVVDRRPAVLSVPISAIGIRGEVPYVMVVDAQSRLQRREIRAGVARGEWREVLEGLAAGEAVVRTNPANFSDGEQVRVVAGVAAP